MYFTFGVHEIWLVAFFLSFVGFYLLQSVRQKKTTPPGPKGVPLLGYLPFHLMHGPSTLFELSKKYGPVILVKIGLQDVLILNDYESVHEALVKRADVFSGRPVSIFTVESTEPGKQEGIINRSLTDDCKVQRKFALTTLRNLGFGKKPLEVNITEEIECFMKVIRAKNGESFDCQVLLSKAVSNVISSILLGSRYSYDDKDFCKMIDFLAFIFTDRKEVFIRQFVIAVHGLRHVPPFSRSYKIFKKGNGHIIDTLTKIIEEHKIAHGNNNSHDFIDEYLKETRRKVDCESAFNERQLICLLRDLFIAGTETTSTTLRWIVLQFARRPDIQEKVAAEISAVIGDAIPSMKHKESLPYTCAFLQEITRHRTLLPFSVAHKTTEDVTFRGYHIAKNTKVFPNLWAVHHDPDYFKDPMEFRPERFIDEEGKFVKDKHVIPFSIGPRYCLGEQLARMELFLFLTNIVQRFTITPNPSKPLPSFDDCVSSFTEGPLEFQVSFVAR